MSLTIRFTRGIWINYRHTLLGAEFYTKGTTIEGMPITVKIWNIPEQERFFHISKPLIEQVEGIILVFDVTDEKSYSSLNYWLKRISNYARKDVVIYLLGNKADLIEDRVVLEKEGELFAKKNKIFYLEASARTGKNVNEVFECMVIQILKKQMVEPHIPSIKLDKFSKPKKKDKCA